MQCFDRQQAGWRACGKTGSGLAGTGSSASGTQAKRDESGDDRKGGWGQGALSGGFDQLMSCTGSDPGLLFVMGTKRKEREQSAPSYMRRKMERWRSDISYL